MNGVLVSTVANASATVTKDADTATLLHGIKDGKWRHLVQQIRAGQAKAGLLTVLERLAPVLSELAPRAADDTNELPDAVVRS